jgi:hypothetical protein
MKPQRLLLISTLLNFALCGAVGYLLGNQHAASPLASISVMPSVAASSGGTLPTVAITTPVPGAHFQLETPIESAQLPQLDPAPAQFSNTAPVAEISRPPEPAGTREKSADADGTPVESSAAGNFLHFQGMRVAVARAYTAQSPANPALGVDITPEPPASAANVAAQNAAIADHVSPAIAALGSLPAPPANDAFSTQDAPESSRVTPPITSGSETAAMGGPAKTPRGDGFTAEEALFRTKWGWTAFDAAQSAAAREAANSSAAN